MTLATDSAPDLLAAIVGAANIHQEEALVVEPACAEETAAVLHLANQQGLNVVPLGGGTKSGFGHPGAPADLILSTRRLNQVSYYDPGDLTFGVGAGATVAAVESTLAQHGQFLPFDSMQPGRTTVGGVLATNAHGPLKHFYGGVRDYCIGIEFATVDGKVVKGGGRVVKNVAGFDLMKLMIGSQGTLGVITGANFKVFPRPKQTRTFIASFSNLKDALEYRDRVVRSALTPLCLEIASPSAQEYFGEPPVVRHPDDYSPSAPVTQRREWRVYVRAAGSDRILARYRSELEAGSQLSDSEEAVLWQHISGFEPSVMARHHNAMVIHMSVPSASVATAIQAAENAALDNSCFAAIIGRAAQGALVGAVIPLAIGPPSAMHYANIASALRAALPRDASVIVARCPAEARTRFDVWGSSPTDIAMIRKVREALDPKGTLSRGRFVV
jgi:glycolate oxidase FAD binding subunit